MSVKASSPHPVVGMSGSGGLSHVFIQFPPLRCSTPGSRGLFYDDGNKMLLSPTNDQVYSWKTVPYDSVAAPISDSISEGPILAIRFSLDGKLIAIQRSNNEIQLQHRETGETFTQGCKSESEAILGFFWTDCPLCDIVIVKTSGLDLVAYHSETKSLHLVETKKFNVSWYVYTHESRLLLLAYGMQCKTFTGFQLSSAGIVRLPKFEMAMAKTEANNKPVLAAEDVHIVTVYGRIYCLQVDRVAMLLHSYRFYRDAVVQQGSLPIYSTKVAVSVVDNVLLVHQVDAKVVILYDIFLDSRAPISAPLPLLLRGFPRSNSLGARPSVKDGENMEATYGSDHESNIYGDDWIFLVPDLICDVSNRLLWKIHLDLEAIAASSSEVSSVLDFLQRRKLEAYKAKQLCLAMARTAILERRPVTMVARAIDVLVSSYSHSLKAGSYFKGAKAEKLQASGTAYATTPRTGVDVPLSRSEATGKSVEHESIAGLEGRSMKRPTFSDTDSDENEGIRNLKPNSNGGGSRLFGAETYRLEGQTSLYAAKSNDILKSTVYQQQERQLASPAISPDEMYTFVFAPVEEEMTGDPSYLVAIIVEFLRSATMERIKVRPNIYVLTAQLLARNERYAELGLFVINKVLEPSKEVALQLLESGRQNRQTRKLGLEMLRQLSLHHDYVVFLVQDGYFLEALRYMKKHKVNTIRPSLFLEAAYASNSQHLAAVLRFFSDYIPGFRNSADHHSYYHILNEMNMAVPV